MSTDDTGWPYRGLVYSLFVSGAGVAVLPVPFLVSAGPLFPGAAALLAVGWLARSRRHPTSGGATATSG